MAFYADLHIHSKYSRATSRHCDLEHLAWWARRKGIAVVGTGDFTHPAWFDELRAKLVPAEPGLFRLRPEIEREVARTVPAACQGAVRFMLEVEISTIYKKGEKTRKVHHLIYAPDFATAGRFRDRLGQIGNIASDGRPILGLDSRHLLEIALESGPDAYLVPAHIWTPWFSALGSKSGFDAIAECYGDLAEHIFAVETGLSSDPPMNWRVSSLDRYTLVSNSDAHSPPMLGREACVFDTELDYFAIRRALESGAGYGGTVEFFPEEGKYHLDGHRACAVRLEPEETRGLEGRCPTCGKPLTVGVLHRVETLADRAEGERPEAVAPFRSIVPLPEMVAELYGVGSKTKTVERTVSRLVTALGPELEILERQPLEDVARLGDARFAEAVRRLRAGEVRCEAGFDGEYGTVRLFTADELAQRTTVAPGLRPVAPGELEPGLVSLPVQGVLFADRAERQADAEPTGAGAAPKAAANPASAAAAPVPPPMPVDDAERVPAGGEGLLGALDPDQRAAAEIVAGPLLIVAGPGTGKTRTLTHRLAHLVTDVGVPPAHCLAITFTRRAAAELRERLEALVPAAAAEILVTTFHGLGHTILREQRGEVGLDRGFRMADHAARRALVRRAFGLGHREAERLLAEVGRAKRASAMHEAAAGARTDTPDAPAATLDTYRALLVDHALVDFDDLLVMPVTLLASRPDLCAVYRHRFRFISIDEYQDIDPLQYRLIRLLAPDDANLCAIGDPDQSIYRFRGADVAFFLRFQDDYRQARAVQLGRNYRSNATIVDAARQAIAPASLVAERRLRAVVRETPRPVVVHQAQSGRGEAAFVVATLERLLGGTSHYAVDSGRAGYEEAPSTLGFDDFAVLYRTAAQAAAIAEALGRAGIPYQRRSHQGLAEQPAVRALIAAAGADPAAGGTVAGRLQAAADRLGDQDARRDEGDSANGDGDGGADDDAPIGLHDALDLLAPLAARFGDDLDGFLDAIATGAEIDTFDPRADRVSLLTLHAAKGLEFPVVFLVGCEDGFLPLRWAEGDDELAEERRLFFVGITRARSRLYLSWAAERLWRGEVRPRTPSPFLADIQEALLERRRDQARTRRKRRAPAAEQLRLP